MNGVRLHASQQPHRKHRHILSVCWVSIVILLCLTLIKSCQLVHSSRPASSRPMRNLRALGEGFQIALENSADSQIKPAKRFRWALPLTPAIKQEKLRESLALRAYGALHDAFFKERQAQDTVRAVLDRREIKHKKLLKGLEEGGWHLNTNEQAAQGTLQKACVLLKAYLRSTASLAERESRMRLAKGRGIAMAAGGVLNLANAYVTLHMLRNVHKSSLPVEIFFDGVEEFDLGSQRLFEEDFADVKCVDVSQSPLPMHMTAIHKSSDMSQQQGGWMTKSQMLYLSSFEEVLVLDSDQIILKDPAFLFESEEYQRAGNLFWPDFWTNNFHNPGPAYNLLGLANPWLENTDLSTTESGQLLIDRRQHYDVLEWVTLLNLHGEQVYDLIWGDKDTYRLAFHLANKASAFSQIVHNPSNALHEPDRPLGPAFLQLKSFAKFAKSTDEPVRLMKDMVAQQEEEVPQVYRHAGMIQMGPDGNMLFLHRTSDAKLDPMLSYPMAYEPLQYMTAPLSARQAAQVHLSGAMGLEKFKRVEAGECGTATGLGLTDLARGCDMIDEGSTCSMPGDVSRLFPVPLFSIDEFPDIQFQLEEGMEAFRRIQQLYLSRQVRLGGKEMVAPEEIHDSS